MHIETKKWLGNGPVVDRVAVAAEWSERGFSCDLWVDPPGQRWDDFVHSTDELVVLLEGHVEVEVDGVAAHIAVGDEWFVPAGALHSVCNVGDTKARWLYGYRRSR